VKVLSVTASCMEVSKPWVGGAWGAAKQSKQATVSLWSISKQHIRQTIRPQPPPSHSESFTVKIVSISSSRGRRRREGDAVLVLLKRDGGGNRWGDGSRVPVPRERGKGPVHVRIQMGHVDALHRAQTRGGLDLIVRWHELHVEILEGLREATKRFGVNEGKGTRGFDERRRRLS